MDLAPLEVLVATATSEPASFGSSSGAQGPSRSANQLILVLN
ncbi:hypothetical protein J2T22_000768 [Pseudarthrobacter defluvii]|uniref:Uncharacterized protein n=1 Tax=Pseudarthrobacter defluvii TaxID=410837 RepID=A0ABT9UD70_9MICC|nr:hypothetical protein [Pseudarthrobacter defluvii]